MIWNVETSHMVNVPKTFEVDTYDELRRRVQQIANRKSLHSDRPVCGELSFRYELDSNDEAVVVHAYFTDRHKKRRRFMRLRKA